MPTPLPNLHRPISISSPALLPVEIDLELLADVLIESGLMELDPAEVKARGGLRAYELRTIHEDEAWEVVTRIISNHDARYGEVTGFLILEPDLLLLDDNGQPTEDDDAASTTE